MSQWNEMTPSLQTGLKLIDALDNVKLRALVNHICSTLQLNNNGKLFSKDEEDRLLISLEVNRDDLVVLLATIKLIYLQVAYGSAKPSAIEALMKEYLPLSDDKVSIFVNAWTAYAKGITECLRHESLFPKQVNDVSWELKIQTSSSSLSQEATPVVWLQLGLTGDKKGSDLTVEMDKNNLTNIYRTFENIQRQFDLLELIPEKNAV